MVVECVAQPGHGGLAFICDFIQENLNSSMNSFSNSGRPWIVIEAPDKRKLFVAGMPTALRMAVADGKVLWVRVQESKQIPEILNLLLESGLCAGIVLRGFEASEGLQVWARRWQLEIERTGTHLLWWHEKSSDIVLGRMLKLDFQTSKSIELVRGWGHFRDSKFQCIDKIADKVINLKELLEEQSPKGEDDGKSINRSPTRVA